MRHVDRWSGSRSGRGRRRRSRRCSREAGFAEIETRRDLAGIERVVVGAAVTRDRLDRGPTAPAAARAALERCIAGGGVAVFPADGLYGLACDPLDEAAIERIHRIKGRDDGKPSAVLYFSPLAMRELLGSLGPRTARGRRRAAARPGDAGRRQPRAPLPAGLPRGSRAARRAPDRRPAGGRDVPDLPDHGQPQRRARPPRFDEVPATTIVDAVDLAIDGGPLTGLPSTVVDITGIDGERQLGGPARGRHVDRAT